jgi:hypothetical protein
MRCDAMLRTIGARRRAKGLGRAFGRVPTIAKPQRRARRCDTTPSSVMVMHPPTDSRSTHTTPQLAFRSSLSFKLKVFHSIDLQASSQPACTAVIKRLVPFPLAIDDTPRSLDRRTFAYPSTTRPFCSLHHGFNQTCPEGESSSCAMLGEY